MRLNEVHIDAIAAAAAERKYARVLAEMEAFRCQVADELGGYTTSEEVCVFIPALAPVVFEVMGRPITSRRAELINAALSETTAQE